MPVEHGIDDQWLTAPAIAAPEFPLPIDITSVPLQACQPSLASIHSPLLKQPPSIRLTVAPFVVCNGTLEKRLIYPGISYHKPPDGCTVRALLFVPPSSPLVGLGTSPEHSANYTSISFPQNISNSAPPPHSSTAALLTSALRTMSRGEIAQFAGHEVMFVAHMCAWSVVVDISNDVARRCDLGGEHSNGVLLHVEDQPAVPVCDGSQVSVEFVVLAGEQRLMDATGLDMMVFSLGHGAVPHFFEVAIERLGLGRVGELEVPQTFTEAAKATETPGPDLAEACRGHHVVLKDILVVRARPPQAFSTQSSLRSSSSYIIEKTEGGLSRYGARSVCAMEAGLLELSDQLDEVAARMLSMLTSPTGRRGFTQRLYQMAHSGACTPTTAVEGDVAMCDGPSTGDKIGEKLWQSQVSQYYDEKINETDSESLEVLEWLCGGIEYRGVVFQRVESVNDWKTVCQERKLVRKTLWETRDHPCPPLFTLAEGYGLRLVAAPVIPSIGWEYWFDYAKWNAPYPMTRRQLYRHLKQDIVASDSCPPIYSICLSSTTLRVPLPLSHFAPHYFIGGYTSDDRTPTTPREVASVPRLGLLFNGAFTSPAVLRLPAGLSPNECMARTARALDVPEGAFLLAGSRQAARATGLKGKEGGSVKIGKETERDVFGVKCLVWTVGEEKKEELSWCGDRFFVLVGEEPIMSHRGQWGLHPHRPRLSVTNALKRKHSTYGGSDMAGDVAGAVAYIQQQHLWMPQDIHHGLHNFGVNLCIGRWSLWDAVCGCSIGAMEHQLPPSPQSALREAVACDLLCSSIKQVLYYYVGTSRGDVVRRFDDMVGRAIEWLFVPEDSGRPEWARLSVRRWTCVVLSLSLVKALSCMNLSCGKRAYPRSSTQHAAHPPAYLVLSAIILAFPSTLRSSTPCAPLRCSVLFSPLTRQREKPLVKTLLRHHPPVLQTAHPKTKL
eukprot:GHVS01033865.1.p1 GENE.GHVS01033865.1~~GHVS01033865.1.p1  ORF type:complete len:1111 (-),score=125.72 GHVS01033865.1:1320-4169(-)